MLSLRAKLSSDLSVEYQVNELLNQARDPGNLAMIFPGWQPWL
jgi:ataxia telangiectasia mutated family protein